jgi:acetyl esterase
VLANEASQHLDTACILGQVLLYPVTDLSRETSSYQLVKSGFPLTASSMRWFGNHYVPAGLDLADPRLSPLLTAERKQPPLFIVTVGHDPLSDEGIAYAGAAARGGTQVEHHHLPRHAHGLFTSAGKIQTGRELLQLASNFVVGTLS